MNEIRKHKACYFIYKASYLYDLTMSETESVSNFDQDHLKTCTLNSPFSLLPYRKVFYILKGKRRKSSGELHSHIVGF